MNGSDSQNKSAPFRRAAVWIVATVAVIGAILSWGSIQGGSISKWVPEKPAMYRTSATIDVSQSDANGQLAKGARIQTIQCAGCHQNNERSMGPSYRDIADRYKGQGSSALADLAGAVAHPTPGWHGYSPGPSSTLPESDRVAVAYWIMQANSEGTNR